MQRRTSLALTFLLAACGDPPPPAAPPLPALPPESVLVAPRGISSPVAFDLVDSPEGAVLGWGPPVTQGGGVRVIVLDPQGTASGTAVSVVDDEGDGPVVDELSLARSGVTVGVGWVERGPAPRIRAALTNGAASGFGEAIDLGPTQPADLARPPRGRILISTLNDGALVASHRAPDGPCASAQASPSCAHIARTRLVSPTEAVRGDDAMEVPSACPSLLAGATSTSGTWFYGVCQANPAPVTTVYAIRPAISFAAATPMLESCSAEGMIALGDRVVVIGRCGDARQAHVVDTTGSVIQRLDAFSSTIACVEGRPNITLASGGESLEIPLRGPQSGIAPALPSAQAAAGARAVWTGEALLVASQVRGEVAVHRFACREGVFARTDA